MQKLTLLTVTLAFLLSATGCTTTDSKDVVNEPKVAPTGKAITDTSKNKREELVDLLVQGFVTDEYINTFGYVDDNCNPTKEINHALKQRLTHDINSLTDSEVQAYIEFFDNGGLELSKKYYSTTYKVINDLIADSLPEEDGIYSFSEETLKTYLAKTDYSYTEILNNYMMTYFNSLTPNEVQALVSMDKLPNADVLNSIFPVYQNKFNLTVSGQLLSILADTYTNVCN